MKNGVLPKNYQREQEKKRWAAEDRQKREQTKREAAGKKVIDRIKNGVKITETVTRTIKPGRR